MVTMMSWRQAGTMAGAVTTIFVLVQEVAAAARVDPKWTVLVPCDAPKLLPLMVIEAPAAAGLGEALVMAGGIPSWKKPVVALFRPFTVTSASWRPMGTVLGTVTMSWVLDQVEGVAGVLPKTKELVPCVAPKPVPLTVTTVPTGPDCGETPVMLGGTPTWKKPVVGLSRPFK